MSNFVFTCPYCTNQFSAQEEWIGASTYCPNCGNKIFIKKNTSPVHDHFITIQEIAHCPIFTWGVLSCLGSFLLLYSFFGQLNFLLEFFLSPYIYGVIQPFYAIVLAAVGTGVIGYGTCRIKTQAIVALAISVSALFYDFLCIFVLHPVFIEYFVRLLDGDMAMFYRISSIIILLLSIIIGIIFYCFLNRNRSFFFEDKRSEMTKKS